MALRTLFTAAALMAAGVSAAVQVMPPALRSAANNVDIEVYAGDFIAMHSHPLAAHPILVYINTFDESQAIAMQTNSSGYLTFQAPVGAKVFLTCQAKDDFVETTTSIVTVPAEGMVGVMNRFVLQVPSNFIFGLFKLTIGRPAPATMCQVVVTICQHGKTYTDDPQGWPGVEAVVTPSSVAQGEARPFYFGVMFNNKTDPLPNDRTNTSWDGGVVLPAIPVNANSDVVITGKYQNYHFSDSVIRCLRPGQFINAAPNQGPRATTTLV